MEILLSVGIGVGLASVAGLRAFLPLAIAGLFGVLGVFEIALPFALVTDPVVLAALFALAAAEISLDKFASLHRGVNIAMLPLRAASGSILFASAMSSGPEPSTTPWLVAGGVLAGAVALSKLVLRPVSNVSAAGVSPAFLSAVEDMAALVGGVVGVFAPYLPLALVAFVLFFFYRVRKRRGRKYEGLRILGD